MSIMTVDKILEAVQTLSLGEQRELRAKLDQRSVTHDKSAQVQVFHEALIAAGLVTAFKVPRAGPVGSRRLIDVKGTPLSQTIIEERR